MYNLIATTDSGASWIIILVLAVLFIGLMAMNFFRNKKYDQTRSEMIQKIEIGAKIKTYSGFYGTVEKITNTTDGKVVLLKTGEGENVGYIEIDMNGIYALDVKEEVSEDDLLDETIDEQIEEKQEIDEKPVVKIDGEIIKEKTPRKRKPKSE